MIPGIMKHFFILVIPLLYLVTVPCHSQSAIHFKYECSTDFKDTIHSQITLLHPTGKNQTLYNDTLKECAYNLQEAIIKGTYTLTVCFRSTKYGIDSLEYKFSTRGEEKEMDINVDFRLDIEHYRQNGKWGIKETHPKGYIEICKYYNPPQAIEINYAPHIKSTPYYKGPFFIVRNNTTDTIYGKYLPGYLWGSLTLLTPDSIENKAVIGGIDYNFAPEPPLLPNSEKTALVGSFGYFHKTPKSKYLYTLLFSKKPQARGFSKYLETKHFIWWVASKEYYKLEYEFEVK